MGGRSYSSGTEKALFLLSRGKCYMPACNQNVLMSRDGDPFVNVEIAHIGAHRPNGPRFDPDLKEPDRKSFSNLILLCRGHHDLIDRKDKVKIYTVEVLTRWKVAREEADGIYLKDIEGVTDDTLRKALIESVLNTMKSMESGIARLEGFNADLADSMRMLYDEMFKRPYLDIDAVGLLAESSRGLAHLGQSAYVLNQAATALGHLEGGASRLEAAADRLGNLEAGAGALREVAGSLESIKNSFPRPNEYDQVGSRFDQIADRLGRAIEELDFKVNELVSELDEVVKWNETVESDEAGHSKPVVVNTKAVSGQVVKPWEYIRRGMIAGFSMALVIAVLMVAWQANNG